MKADAITQSNCKLAPASFFSYNINWSRWWTHRKNGSCPAWLCNQNTTTTVVLGHHGCVSMPAVVVISLCLLYPALSLMLDRQIGL